MVFFEKVDFQEFYLGGVPPFSFFFERTKAIKHLSASYPCESETDLLGELCLIGLAAYFEAYCKAQFAAIVNIYPSILDKFLEQDKDCTLMVKDLLDIIPKINYRIGSLLIEQLDFGSAGEINKRFFNLLGITPFSKKEKELYDKFLMDRNLLAHHGGIFTMKYQRQKLPNSQGSDIAHRKSLVIKREDIQKFSEFLLAVAEKIANSSKQVLEKTVGANNIKLDEGRELAINMLNIS
jgi:hypothetical protein